MNTTKMTTKTCKFYNTGFCKYSDACRFRHAKENCLGECDKRICEKRHPKPCKFGNGCKRGQTCCYNHLKSPKIDTTQDDLKAEILANERQQLKIQNIELELTLSNGKSQLAPKKATEQDSIPFGKSASKKVRTKDLIQDSLLEIRGTQKSKVTQKMAYETLVTKPMSTVRTSDDATGNVKTWPPFSFQQGTV